MKNAGDLNAEEEARLLVGQGGVTFVEEAKLTDVEKAEVTRRIFEAHGPEDEGGIGALDMRMMFRCTGWVGTGVA